MRTWIRENEEARTEGPVILREAKFRQMLSAKKGTAKSRGGREAIYAALAVLTADGLVILESCPRKRNNKGDRTEWVREAVEWMEKEGWMPNGDERRMTRRKAEEANQMTVGKRRGKHLVIDIGEGWGSVRNAVREMEEDVTSIGVDRRGFTYTGTRDGVITAAVTHDLTEKGSGGVLESIAKKAGRSIRTWTLLWASPECSPLSIANAMNQSKGAAHGKWATTQENRGNATTERIEQEKEYSQEAEESLRHLIAALEHAPSIQFALENPATSDLWKSTVLTQAMERHPQWRKVRVDQCAYGRKSQKPTNILTNMTREQWTPGGRTGDGRCKIGKCAGTSGNAKGDRRHEEQTVPNSKERRPSQGEKQGGRREYTGEAVVNAVAADLVQEVVRAAMRCD